MEPGQGGGYFVLKLHGGCFDALVYHTTLRSAEDAWRAFHELDDDVRYDDYDPESDHDCLILYGDFIDVVDGDPDTDDEKFVTRSKEFNHRMRISERRRFRDIRAALESLKADIDRVTDVLPDDEAEESS